MFKIQITDVERLVAVMKDYPDIAEQAINDVLHNEIGDLAQAEIKRLMPRSRKKKGAHAKDSNSLRNDNGNLSVTVRTQKKFQYLYFPDDGTNTRRHIGDQQFFKRGGEAVQGEIVDRCINKITNNL